MLDLLLVADTSYLLQLSLVILQTAVGLGAVVFVHELGHFAVARMCGVKCEKFMVGFDIGGYKISRQWGETVYGIGIVPFGGYVKMLGQDDDPSKIAEQVEKSQSTLTPGDGVEITGPKGEKYVVDRRSYLAKSVPQKMAIISAGVVMNVIFAFIFAVIAFGMGVPYMPSIVSETMPGAPAWEAGLRTGDEIEQIGDIVDPSFAQLTGSVTLADLENGVPLVVRRAETGAEESITLKPRQANGKGLARIGIVSPRSLRLHEDQPVLPGSAAAAAQPPLEGGDEIVRVGDEPVANFRQLAAELATRRDQPLELTVRRGGEEDPENQFALRTGGEMAVVTLPPQRMRQFGLAMQLGPVVAVQPGSPAAEAGIEVGDVLTKINGQPIAGEDPLALPYRLQKSATDASDVAVTVMRGDEAIELTVTPRVVDWLESPNAEEAPLSIPALGVALEIKNEVTAVVSGSPADHAGLAAGDRLESAELTIPLDDDGTTSDTIELGDALNWPYLMTMLQRLPAGAQVEFTYQRSGQEQSATLEPTSELADAPYLVERGLQLMPYQRIRLARSFQHQLQLAGDATVESLLLVYRFLQKIGTQVPVTALGGPITIARAAGHHAFEGFPKFLMFLTMLSANLAVINFLPIPLLDGGHMVFLAYEGIFRRPANERVVVALHMLGFVFIISLMLFVIALDVGLIPRNL